MWFGIYFFACCIVILCFPCYHPLPHPRSGGENHLYHSMVLLLVSEVPDAASSPQVTYPASDVRIRNAQRAAEGEDPPSSAAHSSPSREGPPQAKKPTLTKSSGQKPPAKFSTKICPICNEASPKSLRHHGFMVHIPWYTDLTCVCWSYFEVFRQPAQFTVHWHVCPYGYYPHNVVVWAPWIKYLFKDIAKDLSLDSPKGLVRSVLALPKLMPKPGMPIKEVDQEIMKL